MKMSYDKAIADVIRFNNSDIVTTSGYCAPNQQAGEWSYPNCDGPSNGAGIWDNGSAVTC